jgi:hypothetical protein
MFKPSTINNNNFKNKNELTLKQILNKEPVIIKLNDVINTKNKIINLQETTNLKNVKNINDVKQINHNFESSSTDSSYSTEIAQSYSSKKETTEIPKSKKETTNIQIKTTEPLTKIKKETSEIPDKINSELENNMYWQFGNSGLKIKKFKEKMSRNLSIMYYIDRLFNEYIDTILTNNYAKLFNNKSNTKYTLKSGIINAINGNVTATIKHNKLNGTFKVLDAGFVSLSNINIKQKELKKNSIPDFNSLISHKDNIYHITKIIKIFSLINKMSVKSNISNNYFDFNNITSSANNYIDDLIIKNKKNKILKANKNSAFYIKIYNDRGKGFIIDEKNNIIYYISSNINFRNMTINLRYYAFEIFHGKIKKI